MIQYIVTRRDDPTIANAKGNVGARLLFNTQKDAWQEIETAIKPCQRKHYTAVAVGVFLLDEIEVRDEDDQTTENADREASKPPIACVGKTRKGW